MKNSSVNDIFQNDSGSKNKTKTILLLTIVAVILIAVFLIIAWVMTRDNHIQVVNSINNPDTKIQNPTSNNQNVIPYAHNIPDNTTQHNTNVTIVNPNDILGLNTDTQNQMSNNPISETPPVAVNTQTTNNIIPNLTSANNMTTNSNQKQDELNYEKDEKFQANLKNLAQTAEPAKISEKVITPLQPKEVPIAVAPDPTKQNATKPKTQAEKPKESTQKDTQKQEVKKDTAYTSKPATASQNTKTPTNTQNDARIIQKPTNPPYKEQGASPTKGFYIQVGSFSQDKVDPVFLNKVSKYPYRKETEKGTTKYLIGPFQTSAEATRHLQNIKTEIDSGAYRVEKK